jgi:ABC-2 type transport system permease protein
MTRSNFVLAFAWFYGYSNIRRAPIYILAYLSLPLSLLFFIYIISKGELLAYGIVGGLISVINRRFCFPKITVKVTRSIGSN